MDPYLTLGVPRGCTREEVKEAFRARARGAHPDQGGEPLSFIQLRAAYEQVLNDLGGHDPAEGDPSAAVEASAPASSRSAAPGAAGPSRGGYSSWVRDVADQSRRRRPDPKAVRLRRLGTLAILVLLAANAAVFWSLWEFGPALSEETNVEPDPPNWTVEDAGPAPMAPDAGAIGRRHWARQPANVSDFFIVPADGTLYFAPLDNGRSRLGPRAAADSNTEFGLISANGEVSPIFKGLPERPIPNREINAGPVAAGSKLRLFLKKGNAWAFSDGISAQASFESFADRDYSLDGGGSIVEQIGENTWILHLDDIGSTDDDDDDILVRVRLVTE